MRLHAGNTSKLLRRAATGQCKYCGTPVEWFDRYDTQRIPLTMELPARRIPERFRWHVDMGIAYPGSDPRGSRFCRLPHPAIRPAPEHADLPRELADVVATLKVGMRARIDRGDFTPAPLPEAEDEVGEPDPTTAQPAQEKDERHTLHYASRLRLGPCRIEDIRCIAALPDGERCPNAIYDRSDGRWDLIDIPYAPGRAGQMILNTTGGGMWAWCLHGNDFPSVSRWLNQRCTDHDTFSTAPDHGPREWVAFHPLRHEPYIITKRPQGYDPPHTEALDIKDGPNTRTQCAADGCNNTTVAPAIAGWKCSRCRRLAQRRAKVHRRWQKHTPDGAGEVE